MSQTTLVWFRNDLRAANHLALQRAVELGLPIIGVFVFEEEVEADCSVGHARRLTFIHQCLSELQVELASKGVPLFVLQGKPECEIPAIAVQANASYVVCTEDDEPKSLLRDSIVAAKLIEMGRHFRVFNDWLLLPKSTLMQEIGRPYEDFSAYRKAWTAVVNQTDFEYCDNESLLHTIQQSLPENWKQSSPIPTLTQLGAKEQSLVFRGGQKEGNRLLSDFLPRIDYYHLTGDFPARQHASQLSVYLRFGVISIRMVVDVVKRYAGEAKILWLNALAKREFYHQLFYHNPNALNQGLTPRFFGMNWPGGADYLTAWKRGKTGYPLVDAAMRRLNQTGYLPDSLRRFAAAFLTQVLLCDWHYGAAHFAEQLVDFDWAVNYGNWQDAAGVGSEKSKFFRLLNPLVEAQRLDPDGTIVRRYIPELAGLPKDVIHTPWLVRNTIQTNGYSDPIVNYIEQKQLAFELLG